MLGWAEFDGDVVLGLDGLAVEEGGFVAPLADGGAGGGKEIVRAAEVLYVQDLAEISDGDAELYGFRRGVAVAWAWIAGPNEGDELTGLQASGFMRGAGVGRD